MSWRLSWDARDSPSTLLRADPLRRRVCALHVLCYLDLADNVNVVVMAATLSAGREFIISRVPLARIGAPEDVASACIFLSSQAGAFVNGAIIPLDGGSLTAGGQGNANL